jgi:SAM-dependent methyltransferase
VSGQDDYIKVNQAAWNKRTEIHVASDFYDMPGFKSGATSLKPFELRLLGDVTGRSILHLQCHFGQDTLSLSRMGAKVTGVDFSDAALQVARETADELGLSAEFVLSDVLKLDLGKTVDTVFGSYGVLGWLPDVAAWMQVAARHLPKGGELVLVEFHPLIWLFDQKAPVDYFHATDPDVETQTGSYTDGGEDVEITSCYWGHTLSDVLRALRSCGFELTLFEEYDHSPYPLAGMVERAPGEFVLEDRIQQRLPHCYALRARKL